MAGNPTKRQRSNNWTFDMKETLKTLVKPKAHIIDSKDNDVKMISMKIDVWKSIQDRMKALGYDIPPKRLKQQWGRMKMHAKNSTGKLKRVQVVTTGVRQCPEKLPEVGYTEERLFKIKFEIEEMRKAHVQKMNELEISIKEEELEIRRKENLLISIKLQKEQSRL